MAMNSFKKLIMMANQASKKQNYLTFEALNDGVKLLYTRGTSTFQCSTDLGLTWQDWLPENYSPILNVGDKLLVKCVNPVINSTSGIGKITSDQTTGYTYKVSGDIMSMIYGDDAAIHYSLKGYDRCFSIFLQSQRLLDAGDLVLKARELAPYCYNQLLYGCNYNTRLPKELPAENLASNCYRYFSNGGLYTDMPIIKATSATTDSFNGFLASSTKITKIDLSSIKQISGDKPLNAAFKNCSSLNYIKIGWKQWANPSSLSASWVEGVASQGTFVIPDNAEFDPEEIRGVNGIPEGWDVYTESEWEEINSLTESDKAINTILKSIIQGTDLNDINTLFATINSSGEDYSAINQELKEIILNGYEPIEDYYLTIEALEDDLIVSFSTNTIQYTIDNGNTWNELPADTTTPAINTGDKISFKRNAADAIESVSVYARRNTEVTENAGIGTFSVNKNFNLKGNVMSMIFGDEGYKNHDLTGYDNAFSKMFYECTTLQSVSEGFLPAEALSDRCYSYMFAGCTSLTEAPLLTAKSFGKDSYYNMFFECSSLESTPELPDNAVADKYLCIEALASDTYVGFDAYTGGQVWYSLDKYNWTEVVYRYEEHYDEYEDEEGNVYEDYWEEYVQENEFPTLSAGQKLYIKGTLGWNDYSIIAGVGHFYIYQPVNLSGNCNSIVFCDDADTNFDLSVINFDGELYVYMFDNNPIINISKDFLPATTLTRYCYNTMFSNCPLHNYPDLPATDLAEYCYGSMFSWCIPYCIQMGDDTYGSPDEVLRNLTINLPATDLAEYCYGSMFYNSFITKINAGFLAFDGDWWEYGGDWVYDDTGINDCYNELGIQREYIKDDNAEYDPYDDGVIPEEWIIGSSFVPTECTNLSITADNVAWYDTNTTIYYTAKVNGYGANGNFVMGEIITGIDVSSSFEQNLSDKSITRTISYTYMGVTATTTITQDIWKDKEYSISLNNQWQSSSVANPDSSLYDGVYESFSNKGADNTAATMYIDIVGYNNFDLYIRSYAESSYDYVIVSQLDQTINNNTLYSDTTLVKAHTFGNQKSGTSIDNYTKVSFTGIDGVQHRITIIYRKDGSGHRHDDRGYVLIPKNQ